MTAKIFCRSFKKVFLTTYVVMGIGGISKVNNYIDLSRVRSGKLYLRYKCKRYQNCSWSQ